MQRSSRILLADKETANKETANKETTNKDEVSVASSSSSAIHPKLLMKYTYEVAEALRQRNEIRVYDNHLDVTPKPIDSDKWTSDFKLLHKQTEEYLKNFNPMPDLMDYSKMKRASLSTTLRITIDDIVQGIANGLFILKTPAPQQSKKDEPTESGGLGEKSIKFTPFIKVYLRQTDDIVLYEQSSSTVPARTEDAELVEKDNRAYEYMIHGKGRLVRKADSEAQTNCVLYKSREVNTDTIRKINTASYVSYFEMFDTYEKLLEPVRSSIKLKDEQTLDVMTYNVGGSDPFDKIGKLPEFEFAQMVVQRMLAGNVYEKNQRRFRNMSKPDPLAPDVKYLYTVDVLWILDATAENWERHAVSCISWCPSNGDILALGYGVFTCSINFSTKQGFVAIWSIKNPVNPEKLWEYHTSVSAVEFSPYRPQLIAIGLYDGSVEVRDITTDPTSIVASSQRETSPGYEPVTDLKWIPLDAGESGDIESLLTVSQDGSVMRYRVINSPHLLGYQHAVLYRVEGSPEGLPVIRPWKALHAGRTTQCLGITLDPLAEDIFYVISNEGVIYKCSTNYPQQHLSLWQTHEGAVYSMEFSPWSPKLFLTCGDDWCIRIWIDGIFKPLITLTSHLSPIYCACWSKTHSTVIISITRRAICVWDIRRSTLKPMSSGRPERTYMTMTKVSNCGRSIAVGNERGCAYVCKFEDMPFEPHFQYEELESAIFKALMPYPDLVTELRGVGYFGYPKKRVFD